MLCSAVSRRLARVCATRYQCAVTNDLGHTTNSRAAAVGYTDDEWARRKQAEKDRQEREALEAEARRRAAEDAERERIANLQAAKKAAEDAEAARLRALQEVTCRARLTCWRRQSPLTRVACVCACVGVCRRKTVVAGKQKTPPGPLRKQKPPGAKRMKTQPWRPCWREFDLVGRGGGRWSLVDGCCWLLRGRLFVTCPLA